MLVGPHQIPLSAGEWRSEDDFPRPFFPGVVSRGGERRVAPERKKERPGRGQGGDNTPSWPTRVPTWIFLFLAQTI